ncbi:ABC transporter permease [Brevibacterium sp. FAM 24638]|uniref:ABC transporter permease n=1 Tax=Brevibacterium sp. FAM 24638 TaxID=3415681 RepID=UPI003C7C12CD
MSNTLHQPPPRTSLFSGRKVFSFFHKLLIVALYIFLLSPLFIIAILSFNSGSSLNLPLEGFSLRWYSELLSNGPLMDGFRVSLVVGVIIAVVDLFIGVSVAFVIDRFDFPGRSALSGLFLAPLMVPTVVLGLALLLVLSPLFLTGTYLGIAIAHFAVTVPYVVRTTLINLQTADTACEEAARVLGAGPFTVFRRVTLPIIMPGVLAGAVMAFIISFDEAVISLFVASSGRVTLPVEMFRYVEFRADPLVAALSFILILLALAAVLIVERIVGLRGALK